jgi:hypothetical protein
MKEPISTLNAEINQIRRNGNSTRQVDFAIQKIFEGEIVLVQDAWEWGNHEKANHFLFKYILRRLYAEHNLSKKDLKIDERQLTISIMPTYSR